MLTEKVKWNDTHNLCAGEELISEAKSRCKGGKCLFLTFNSVNGTAGDMGVRNYLKELYTNDMICEDIGEDWGRGCNIFIFGDGLLGRGDDYDKDEVMDCVWQDATDKGYINAVEDRLIRAEWLKYCEEKGIKDDKAYGDFENFMLSEAELGAYDIEYDGTELARYMGSVLK